MGNRYNLDTIETNAALDFFMHHLSMDLRGKLMAQLPSAYNKLVGREVCRSVNLHSARDVLDLVNDAYAEGTLSPLDARGTLIVVDGRAA